VVDALITGIDRVFRHGDARLVFIMASNLSERIDPAVRRRAMVYQFTRPSDDERRTILSRSLGEILDIRTLDDLNRALRRQGVVLTAADVLNQVIAPAIWESAHHDRSIDAERLLALAAQAVATPAVAQG
jgi:AAA+ superfamily predicted ATPase